jgi:hypothetical protein
MQFASTEGRPAPAKQSSHQIDGSPDLVDPNQSLGSQKVPAAQLSARRGHLRGLLLPAPRLRSRGGVRLPPSGSPPPRADGVELHLLVPAVLAAEGRVAAVHEDVAVPGQMLGAERARVQRGHAVLGHGLGVEEEAAAVRCRHSRRVEVVVCLARPTAQRASVTFAWLICSFAGIPGGRVYMGG